MNKPHRNTPWKGWRFGTALDPVRCFIIALVRPADPEPVPTPDAGPLFLPNHVIPRSAWGLGPRQPADSDESKPEGT